MNIMEPVKSGLKKYLCSHDLGEYLEDSGMCFIKSGSASPVMNFVVIDKIQNPKMQRESFDKNFDNRGFVVSIPAHQPMIMAIKPELRYLGNVFISVSRGYSGDQSESNVQVEELSFENANDYLEFMERERGVEKEISREIISACSDDIYVYVAYSSEKIVGAGSAIRNGDSIYIFDTIVTEEHRDSGVFSAILTKAMSDVSKTGKYNYYAIISSPQSLAGSSKANYERKMVMDLWIKES